MELTPKQLADFEKYATPVDLDDPSEGMWMTLDEAYDTDLEFYHNGWSCRRGHWDQLRRIDTNNMCVACEFERGGAAKQRWSVRAKHNVYRRLFGLPDMRENDAFERGHPITSARDFARQNEEKFYNTGRPCVYGHHSDRYTSTGNCAECLKEYRE